MSPLNASFPPVQRLSWPQLYALLTPEERLALVLLMLQVIARRLR